MRLHDWMMRFEALVLDRQHTRFAFGAHDCSMWACDVVLAITGRDPAVDLRGSYQDEAGAEAVMAAGGGLAAMAAARFGDEIHPAMAATGDIGLIETPRGPALVVCNGPAWLAAAPFGLAVVPTREVLRAWRCEVT